MRTSKLAVAAVCLALAVGCGSSDGVDSSASDGEQATSIDEDSAENHDEDNDGEDEGDRDGDDYDDNDGDGERDHDDRDRDGDEGDHDEAAGGLGAHVHGSADLFVGWSGNDVVIDLISPSNNIFGFENEPTTDEELTIVSQQTDALTAPDVLVLSEQASCELAGDVATELEFEGSHAEVAVSWLYICDNPSELRELDLSRLFAEFPGLEDIDAQWASDSGQGATELSATSTILRFA